MLARWVSIAIGSLTRVIELQTIAGEGVQYDARGRSYVYLAI